jgi:hypothetical protein
MFPEHNFYFGGPTGLDKLTAEEYNKIFPNKNVFSAYSKSSRKPDPNDEYDYGDSYRSTTEYFIKNNIKLADLVRKPTISKKAKAKAEAEAQAKAEAEAAAAAAAAEEAPAEA